MFGSSKKKPSSSSKKDVQQQDDSEPFMEQEVDFNQINGLLNKEIKDDDIELTDADMNDPDLLAQLSQIESGGGLVKPKPPQQQQQQQPATQKPLPPVAAVTKKAAAPPPRKVRTEEDELADLMKDDDDEGGNIPGEPEIDHELIQDLENRCATYKKYALLSNKAGNKEDSLKYMRGVKTLTAAIEELNEGIPVDTSTLPKDLPQPTTTAQQPQQQPRRSSTPPIASPNGGRASPVVTTPKLEVLTREQIEKAEREQIWELFEEEFKKKQHHLTNEALRLRDVDKSAAINLLRESKAINSIVEQIQLSKQKNVQPPPYHFEQKETVIEVTCLHLKETEIEVVMGACDLLKSFGSIDVYGVGELPYPTPEQPSKFQTPTVSSTVKDFAYKTMINIERKKGLQRCLEKKKLTIVFYSSRMFFMKSIVGKCEVKLSDLLTKCEINEKVPILKEGSKRETGGFVEVKLRMRTPLNSKEVKRTVEKVLVVDTTLFKSVENTTSVTSSSTTTTTTTATVGTTSPPSFENNNKMLPPQTTTTTTTTTTTSDSKPTMPISKPAAELPVKKEEPVVPTPKPVESKPVAQISKPAAAATPDASEEDDEDLVNDLDRVVSFEVFESMLESIALQLSKGPNQELLDRKQAIEIKKMVLETQVDSGLLTMEGYINQVQAAMEEDKKLARDLSAKGKKDLAIKIMSRIKIMRNELESS
eukprot:gene3844-4788_t